MSGIDAINPDLGMLTVQASAAAALQSGAAKPASSQAGKTAQAVKAAKDFESVLLNKVMEEMQNTVDHSGLLDGAGTEQTQSMFWMFLSQDLAAKGGVGLWKDVYRQMTGAEPPATLEQVR